MTVLIGLNVMLFALLFSVVWFYRLSLATQRVAADYVAAVNAALDGWEEQVAETKRLVAMYP